MAGALPTVAVASAHPVLGHAAVVWSRAGLDTHATRRHMEAGMGKFAIDTDVFGKEPDVQGQSDSTVGRVLAFYSANSGAIPCISQGPL